MLADADDAPTGTKLLWDGFRRLDFSSQSTVVVAVSGGSDSIALLNLFSQYAGEHEPSLCIVAATVDHQLRSESRTEAQEVAMRCEELGIKHITKPWLGPKPETGIQSAARDARYRLLREVAVEHGAGLVLTGHSLNDQAETIDMRARRRAGRGMTGIAPATLYERQIWFARPLLNVSRQSLRNYLVVRRLGWIDDPSNQNAVFERVQVRNRMLLKPSGAKQISSKARNDADERMVLDKLRTRSIEQRMIEGTDAARFILDTSATMELTRDVAIIAAQSEQNAGSEVALRAIASLIGQKPHFPSSAVTTKIMHFTESSKNGHALTAHGCHFLRKGEKVFISRESRNKAVGRFGLDVLLPSFDYSIAVAIVQRTGEASLPPMPFCADSVKNHATR